MFAGLVGPNYKQMNINQIKSSFESYEKQITINFIDIEIEHTFFELHNGSSLG